VLVVPFCVILAWCLGQPLDLNFNEFEALVLFISVLLAAVVVQVGVTQHACLLHAIRHWNCAVFVGRCWVCCARVTACVCSTVCSIAGCLV
jgi:Ca2+:H+ antiporter